MAVRARIDRFDNPFGGPRLGVHVRYRDSMKVEDRNVESNYLYIRYVVAQRP